MSELIERLCRASREGRIAEEAKTVQSIYSKLHATREEPIEQARRARELQSENASLRAKLADAEEELDAYNMDGNSAAMEVAELRGRLQGARDELAAERERHEESNENYIQLLKEARAELAAERELRWKAENDEEDMADTMGELRAERDALRTELAAAREALVKQSGELTDKCNALNAEQFWREKATAQLAAERADKTRIAEGWNKASDERDALRAELAAANELAADQGKKACELFDEAFRAQTSEREMLLRAENAEKERDALRTELAAARELLHKLTAIIPGNDGAGKKVAEFLAALAKEAK